MTTPQAGLPPAAAGTGAGRAPTPAAIAFDLATRRFDPDTELHPVDAWMVLTIGVELGTFTSSPEWSNNVRSATNRQAPARVLAIVQGEITRITAPAVARGDVRVEAVDVDTSVRGRLVYAVTYTNLRTGQRQTARG